MTMTNRSASSRRLPRRVLRLYVKLRRATGGVAAVEFSLLLPLMLMLYLGSAETTQAVMSGRKAALAVKTLSDLVSQQAANTNMLDLTMGNIFDAAAAIMQPFGSTQSTSVVGSPCGLTLCLNVSAVSFTAYTSDPTTASAPASKSLVWVPSQNALASSYTPTSSNPGYAAKVRWSVSPSSLNSGSTALTNGAALTRSCGTPLTPVASTVSPTGSNLQQGLYGAGSIVIADIAYSYQPTFGSAVVSWTQSFGWSLASGMTSKNTTYMQPRNTWSACSEATGTKGASDTWICYSAQESNTCLNY